MKKFFTLLLWAFCSAFVMAQPLPNRYKTEIFTNAQITTTTGVAFSTNIPHVHTYSFLGVNFADEERYGNITSPPGQIVTLRMDIYQPNPTIDTLTRRPVIIFCFGGGFVTGSRTETSMIQLCQAFARRGFVTATIDYRLGMNIINQELSKRAVYRGVQDGRSAVRFFRNNAATYRVDPNQIFIAGYSAGGFIALHNIYLDKESERPASTFLYMGTRPDLGTLDAVGDNKIDASGNPISGKANAAMAFAGAVGDLLYVEGSNDAPGLYFHSSDDNTVPYDTGEPFSSLSWLVDLPTVYGGYRTSIRANAVGAPHRFWGYTNRGHSVHFDSDNNVLYSDIAPRGSDFFYDFRLKPIGVTLGGPSVVCSNELTQTYTLSSSGNFYYDWQVVGGTINTTNYQYKHSISITWNPSAPVRSVTCTPYSRWLARALTSVSTTVTINQAPNVGTPIPNQLYQISAGSPTINLTGAFIDPEGGAMTYTATASPAGVVNPSVSGNILTLTIVGPGTTTVTVEATDNVGCKRSQSFTVTVNRPPMVVDPVSSQTIRYADPPFVINDISTIFNDPDGDPLTYTISASPTGVVNISQTGNQVTFTATDINTTTITITANDGKGGAASDSFTITVQRGTQTITFEPISTKFVDESPVTLNAVSNRGLPITFSVIAGTATIAGNTVVFNQAGTITVRASQPGNYYFEPAPSVEQTFQVIKRNQVINFEPVADKVITESGFELNVSASSGLPVTLEVVSGNVTLNGKKVIFNSIGFVTIRASQAGNNVYHPAEPVERSFYVAPENLQLTLQPNPFSGEGFNAILRGKYLGKVQIIVFDNTGRVISNVTFEKQTYFSDTFVKTPQIAPDTYYCKVITDERTFVEKIVKQ